MSRPTTSTTTHDFAEHREACAAAWASLKQMSEPKPAQTMLEAIVTAVQKNGGTVADASALADEWEQLGPELVARADRIREQVRQAPCSCADGGEPAQDGRCGRCYGQIGGER